MSSAPHPILEITQLNRTPLYVSLRGPLELGRECDGILVSDPQVSRRHLLLELAPDGDVIVTDLGSTNGSTMNGVALRNPAPLRVGSIVRCGETTIRLEAPRKVRRSKPGARRTDVPGNIQPGVSPRPVSSGPSPDPALADLPTVEHPVVTRPVIDRPTTDQPVTTRPITNRPAGDPPTGDQPVARRPEGRPEGRPEDRPEGDSSATDRPVKDRRVPDPTATGRPPTNRREPPGAPTRAPDADPEP